MKMTPRQDLVSALVLAAGFLGLGVWALAKGQDGTGAFYLAVAAAWAFIGPWRKRRAERRAGELAAEKFESGQ